MKILIFITICLFALSFFSVDALSAVQKKQKIELLKNLSYKFKNGNLSVSAIKELCKKIGNFAPICDDLLRTTPTPAQMYIAKNGKAVDPNPVIFFPGLGGSGLQAKLHRNNTNLWYCFKTWDWFGIWVELYDGILAQSCWLDNMQIDYFETNNTYGDTRGVDIRPNDFGGLNGVNKLDHFDDPLGLTDYFMFIIKNFEEVGFVAGKTLFGAPYDWRLPVDALYHNDTTLGMPWGQALKVLVEHAYATAGNKRVNLITHSMGGPTALYFLNQQSPDWINQYIDNFIPIAGPWSGAASAVKAIVSGNNFGLEIFGFSFLNRDTIAQIARQAGGVNYLTPDMTFWGNQTFVTNAQLGKSYNSAQFQELYNDLKTPITATIDQRVNDIINDLRVPSVPTYCLYGANVSTEIAYVYPHFSEDPLKVVQPSEIISTMAGDGTVPLLSLAQCKRWDTDQLTIKCKEYDLKGHVDILKDDELVLDMLNIINGKSTGINDCTTTPFYDKLVSERVSQGFVDPAKIKK